MIEGADDPHRFDPRQAGSETAEILVIEFGVLDVRPGYVMKVVDAQILDEPVRNPRMRNVRRSCAFVLEIVVVHPTVLADQFDPLLLHADPMHEPTHPDCDDRHQSQYDPEAHSSDPPHIIS